MVSPATPPRTMVAVWSEGRCVFLATVGEIERAIDTLEHCVPQLLTSHLSWMAQDADMNPLRDHPRYQALIAREQARRAPKKEATER